MPNQNLVKAPTKAELEAKAAAEAEALKNPVESTSDTVWVSPLDVNYAELTELLNGTQLTDYVGDRLPDEEVKRIEKDYAIYLKNK